MTISTYQGIWNVPQLGMLVTAVNTADGLLLHGDRLQDNMGHIILFGIFFTWNYLRSKKS